MIAVSVVSYRILGRILFRPVVLVPILVLIFILVGLRHILGIVTTIAKGRLAIREGMKPVPLMCSQEGI